MADVGEIRARLVLNSDQFNRGMQNARSQMDNTGRSANRVSKDIKSIQKASTVVGGAVVAALGTSVTAAANFEQAMARVAAVSGATGSDFEAMEAKAKELGETTMFSATQAAEGMQYLAMAGFQARDIVASMPSVLNLASAAQIDLGRSADIVSNIMTGFGLKAEDTSHAVDVLVKTMTTANTDLPQLGEAMKYVAPVAASLGLSIEETAAAVAKMSDAGIQGSQAGTALRASLLSLANPVGQTEKAMEALGIKVTDANGNMKPLPELIGHINEKLDGMTSAQKTSTVAQLVGTEAASGFVAMLEIGEEKLSDYASELKNAGGTAERVAKTQMDTLKGSFIEFQSAVEGLGIKIGDDLLPVFTDIVREGTGIVRLLGEMDATGVKAGLAFAGTASALALVATTAIKLGTSLRGLMVAMGPAGWLITSASVIAGVLAGVSVAQKELSEVSLENAEAMEQQRASLEKSIDEYDRLSLKSRLTNDELARFVDVNSLITQTADPDIIAKLREEQERLREKSGLSNDELDRMVELNGKILEVVPDSNTTLTEQGNVLLKNTDKAKAYNAEQAELIRLELEAQRAKAEANMSQYLTDEKRLITEIKDLKKEMKALDEAEVDQREIIRDLEGDLATAKRNNDSAEENRLNILLGVENKKLREMQEQTAESAQQILKRTEELDKIQAQIGKLDEVKRKMVDLELKQVGINSKRGQEIKQLDSAIGKLKEQKRKLQETTPAAQRNTQEYRDAVAAIDNQIEGLNTARSRISDIIGKAAVMNSELGRSINKTVTITERRYGNIVRGKGGFVPEYHTGGIVGRGQMPKLHTGGLASQFANMPNHNEIDVRLLQNEMVLTEAQQANLMRMIDAGFTRPSAATEEPTSITQVNHITVEGNIDESLYNDIMNRQMTELNTKLHVNGVK